MSKDALIERICEGALGEDMWSDTLTEETRNMVRHDFAKGVLVQKVVAFVAEWLEEKDRNHWELRVEDVVQAWREEMK